MESHGIFSVKVTYFFFIVLFFPCLYALILSSYRLKNESKLQEAVLIPLLGATGPESLAFDPNGAGPYTGVQDGRILKWIAERKIWIDFATVSNHSRKECEGARSTELEHKCGRPLGLKFNEKTGDLLIADAYLGLLVVGPEGGLAKEVSTEAGGVPFVFTNSLDLDPQKEVVYFTDSSTRFQRREFMSAIISGDKTGRLIRYDFKTKTAKVLLKNLSFPNGIVVSEDGSFLLLVETISCRILKFWIKTGALEVFASLPGFPDNIKRSARGGFWVALHSRRGKFLQWLLSHSWWGNMVLKLPFNIDKVSTQFDRFKGNNALAIRIAENGEVLEILEDKGAKIMKFISEVEERNGTLWIGSVARSFLGVHKI